jgi:hypothetical protein
VWPSRQPFTHPDERVTPLVVDVTSVAQIQAAADQLPPVALRNAKDAGTDRVMVS